MTLSLTTLALKFIGLLAFLYLFGGWLIVPPSVILGMLS